MEFDNSLKPFELFPNISISKFITISHLDLCHDVTCPDVILCHDVIYHDVIYHDVIHHNVITIPHVEANQAIKLGRLDKDS